MVEDGATPTPRQHNTNFAGEVNDYSMNFTKSHSEFSEGTKN
jgi:hypothetical protein